MRALCRARPCWKNGRMTNGGRFFCRPGPFDAAILCVWLGKPTQIGGKRSALLGVFAVFKQGLRTSDSTNCGLKPGIGCDICILENTYNSRLMRFIHGLGAVSCGFLVSCRRFRRDKEILLRYAEGDRELEKSIIVKAIIGRFVSTWSYSQIVKFQYIWNSQCKKQNSKYVVCINGRKHFFGEIYDREDMLRSEMYEFHGRLFAVMGKTDAYLRHLYGDYMKIPKEEERENLAVFEFEIL